jgi:hypothetical protein
MCDPVITPIVFGVVSAGLGIAQSVSAYQGAQQQVAYQNMVADQNYQYQQMQTSSARAFEDLKEQQQKFLMEQNQLLASTAFGDEIASLNSRFMQEEEAAAQKRQEALKGRAQAVGEIKSSGRLGLSIDNLIADVYRQQAQYDYAVGRNLAFTGDQLQDQKRASTSQYASRLNQYQPYLKQRYLDPLRPIPMAKPSALPYVLGGLSSAVGAASSAYGMYSQTPKPPGGTPSPSPTPGSWSGGASTSGLPSWNDSFKYQPGRTY